MAKSYREVLGAEENEASTSAHRLDSPRSSKRSRDGKAKASSSRPSSGLKKEAKSSGKASDPAKKQYRRPPGAPASSSVLTPGISKIKASIRQTRRLLSKPDLASDVKQEAERRLAALEEDLEAKGKEDQEQKNASRSHKVRFFERQKLVRAINQLKKKGDRKSKEEKDLEEKRTLLNYVLHYPPAFKYIALFPTSGPSPLLEPPTGSSDDAAHKSLLKQYQRASSVKAKIAEAMEKGELSSEPEVELEERMKNKPADKNEGDSGSVSTSQRDRKRVRLEMDDEAVQSGKQQSEKKSKKSKKTKTRDAPVEEEEQGTGGIEDDDFFEI